MTQPSISLSESDDLLATLATLAAHPDADAVEVPSALTAILGDPATWRWDSATLSAAHAALEAARAAVRGDRAAVARAARRLAQGGPAPTLPPLVDAAALLATPPPPIDWVLPGILPAGEVALLVGSDGGGKSALLTELALAVALGVPWAAPAPGQPGLMPAPTSGRVLYVAGEDDLEEHQRCLHAVTAALRLPPAPPGQLLWWPLDGEPLHLMEAHRQAATPAETPAAALLAATLRHVAPRLVILDPLIMCHGLSEADPQHMDSLMRLLIRLARSVPGCALVVAHHAGQASIRDGADDHLVGRGSTGLNAAARAVLSLRRPSAAERAALEDVGEDPARWRLLRGPKISRGPERAPAWLRWRDSGLGSGGAYAVDTPPLGGQGSAPLAGGRLAQAYRRGQGRKGGAPDAAG